MVSYRAAALAALVALAAGMLVGVLVRVESPSPAVPAPAPAPASASASAPAPGTTVFTLAQLAAYRDPATGLRLAVLGSVFDVTRGARHYGPGGSYHFFTGRDGSRAFATGEFTDEGLRDDVDGLTPAEVAEIERWRAFYVKDYAQVGVLHGRYYDAEGRPTDALRDVKRLLRQAKLDQAAAESETRRYPACNTRWSQANGGFIWCEPSLLTAADYDPNKEPLVPRQYFTQTTRQKCCACVRLSEATAAAAGRFELYDGCAPMASMCKTT